MNTVNISITAVWPSMVDNPIANNSATYEMASTSSSAPPVVSSTSSKKKKALDLSNLRYLVLDEADEMLSMGFVDDIERILQQTPATRQTALFSATLPKPIRKLAQKYLKDPQAITIKSKELTVDTIEQRFYVVDERNKFAALTRIIEMEDINSALIFARTRASSRQLANELVQRGFTTEALNGDLSQDARMQILDSFREKKNQHPRCHRRSRPWDRH